MEKQNALQMTPASLLEIAVNKDVDIDKIEKLMNLYERWEARQAKKLFLEALVAFQSEIPIIEKSDKVGYESKAGGKVAYNYSGLPVIIKAIKPALKNNGLSYRWETEEINSKITLHCIISHVSGHSEKNTMSAEPDTSGSKNSIQSRGSTMTYLQRYTLIGALGLPSADTDNDGEGARPFDKKMEAEINKITTKKELSKYVRELKHLHKHEDFKTLVRTRESQILENESNGSKKQA